jgi:hypothetical protein
MHSQIVGGSFVFDFMIVDWHRVISISAIFITGKSLQTKNYIGKRYVFGLVLWFLQGKWEMVI